MIIKNLKQIPYISISEVSFTQVVGNRGPKIGAKWGKTNPIEQIWTTKFYDLTNRKGYVKAMCSVRLHKNERIAFTYV